MKTAWMATGMALLAVALAQPATAGPANTKAAKTESISGVLKSVDRSELTADSGRFGFKNDTQFTLNGAGAKAADLKAGDKLTISYVSFKEGGLTGNATIVAAKRDRLTSVGSVLPTKTSGSADARYAVGPPGSSASCCRECTDDKCVNYSGCKAESNCKTSLPW